MIYANFFKGGFGMDEKRKSRRAPIRMELAIQSLYKSGDRESISLKENVLLTDISNAGIGFIGTNQLPVNHFFNAKIIIDNERMFYCVLKIVRSDKFEDGYHTGCEFVGLANILGEYIDEYIQEI